MGTLQSGRRNALLMAAGLFAARDAAAVIPPETGPPLAAAIVVAGPPQGRLDRWADLLVPALARVFPGASNLARSSVARSTVGGSDGVTGANQFQARVALDGGTALLLPGSAAMAWLIGDPRAQFDVGRWVPAWAGLCSAVLVSRGPLRPGHPLRVGGALPAGATLPALLALDMLRIDVTPADDSSADAVFHYGQGARAAAAQSGMTPVLTLGTVDAAGAWLRDPAFPAVPTVIEAVSNQVSSPALLAALRATAAATVLDAALVLPQLSPANRVALWRRACAEASVIAGMMAAAAALGIRPVPPPATATIMAAIAADAPTVLALRSWLDARWGWRPG